MSERIPTPSTEFSNVATERDIAEGIPSNERRYNLLEAQEAAYAAKPFMDVAVELYESQEDKELALDNTDLNTLIDYAEQRARFAAEKGEVRQLSDEEQKILDVYKAKAESDKVKLELGDTYLEITPDNANSASIEAEDRSKQATTREEKSKWIDMERKSENYAHYLSSGQDDQYDTFSTNTAHVAGLLSRMNIETGTTTEWDGKPVDEKKLRLQAHNLRNEAEMLKFIGNHTKLEKQKEQIANTSTRSGSSEAGQETKISLPDDERERTRFVKGYFAEHSDIKDPKNEAVLKEFILKETQYRIDEVKRMNRPGLKVDDRAAMIFRLGAFNNATLGELAPELRFTYQLLADKKPGLSYSEFDAMPVDEIASTLGVDVHKDIEGYDQFVKKGQRLRKQFPNIDR
jgi:hypothetical protein